MSVVTFLASIPSPAFREMTREEPKAGIGGLLCLMALVCLLMLFLFFLSAARRYGAFMECVHERGLLDALRKLERLDRKERKMTDRLESGTLAEGDSEERLWEIRVQLFVCGMTMRHVLPEQFHFHLPPIRHVPPPPDTEENPPSA